jgi:hypothetical protein
VVHSPLFRSHLLGAAVLPDQLEKLARYETHLDRKLQRLLGMLLKLQEIRQTWPPGRHDPFRKKLSGGGGD